MVDIGTSSTQELGRDPCLLGYLDSICSMPDVYSNQEEYTYSLGIYQDLKQTSYCDKESVVSDASSTSSESRRRSYQSRIRKENNKERHQPRGKRIKRKDLSHNENRQKLSIF